MVAGIRRARPPSVRAFLIAGTVPFAGPGVFEVVFQETGRFVHPAHSAGYALPYVMISYATWGVLGLTGVAWWRVSWRWWIVLAHSGGGFSAWIAIGFPRVTAGTAAQLRTAYFLNISLKGSFYLVFLLSILEGMYFARTGGSTNSSVGVVRTPDIAAVPTGVEDTPRVDPSPPAIGAGDPLRE
jgi:hypothetical protein